VFQIVFYARPNKERRETMSYKFAILDPRTIPVAMEGNDKIFAGGEVIGIEVTVPALAARCKKNLDPQHEGGDIETAAIEAALTEELPPDGAILATVRADLDSVGAMAIFCLRREGADLKGLMVRVGMVADSDKFARGPYPGPRGIPTKENSWPTAASASESRPLAAIAAAVSDFKVPLADRVQVMKTWLLSGEEPARYREQVEKERADLITALEGGQIKTETHHNGKVAVVVSSHRAATSVGYAIAPVVVALNPEFRVQGGDPHTKFTICQYQPGYVDLVKVKEDLAGIETGWGGSPTIIGSPQGTASQLTIEQVLGVVERHLS